MPCQIEDEQKPRAIIIFQINFYYDILKMGNAMGVEKGPSGLAAPNAPAESRRRLLSMLVYHAGMLHQNRCLSGRDIFIIGKQVQCPATLA